MNEILNTVEFLLANEFQIQCNFGRLRLPSFVGDVAYLCDWCIQKAGLYHQKVHVLSEMNKNIACSVAKAKEGRHETEYSVSGGSGSFEVGIALH
jgi:hypothetical protein